MVGQERSKKVLSVAVYNHYKRVHNNIPTKNSKSSQGMNNSVIDKIRQRGTAIDLSLTYPYTAAIDLSPLIYSYTIHVCVIM